MGIPADEDFDEVDDGCTLVAERLNPSEASIVMQELTHAGIDAHVLALPADRQTGPYDIIVLDGDSYTAQAVIQRIEVIEEPDNWFSDRPVWQQGLLIFAGIIAILIPLFFALVAILSNS